MVPNIPPKSRCSSGSPIDFHWFEHGASEDTTHATSAENEFVRVLESEDRYWTGPSLAIARSEFRRLVRRASAGRATPVTHVKAIRDTEHEHLYELRWTISTISLGDVRSDGREPERKGEQWQVRMYHSEPELWPLNFVGLHIHHKVIAETTAETDRLQDVEIDRAISRYWLGAPTEWGLRIAPNQGKDIG